MLPYLDIPFQHASPDVLKAMKRPAAQDKTLDRIKKWREICPDLDIRSTFIVGFPGETESDFQYLLDWLEEARSTASAASNTSRWRARSSSMTTPPFKRRGLFFLAIVSTSGQPVKGEEATWPIIRSFTCPKSMITPN
jgi:hypothetical protein